MHIFHININIFVGVEQKFHQIFWKRLFLSLKSNSCIFFRPMLSANINAESSRFSWLFLAKDWMKLPHVYFPFSHWHLFCFGGIMYHRLILTHRICYSSLHHRKSISSTGQHTTQYPQACTIYRPTNYPITVVWVFIIENTNTNSGQSQAGPKES